MTAAHAGMSEAAGAKAAKRGNTGGASDGDAENAADPDEATAEPSPVSRRRRRLIRGGKLLAVTTSAVLFLVAASGFASKLVLDAQIRQVAALDLASASIVNAAAQAGAENFLLVGTDDLPGGGSDSIMVVHVPADRSRAALLSFPRNLEIDRPECQRWDAVASGYRDERAPAEPTSKLAAAYETGGPACLTKVVQQLTGLSVTRFVGIDLTGVKEMVDAVQGVEICLEQPVIDGVLGVVVPDAGTSTIDGNRALELLRARNVRGDPAADYGQIQRQQRFLSALLRTAASNQMALDPTATRNFVAAFALHGIADNVRLDELTMLAEAMQGLDPATVSFLTAPTTGASNERGNEVLREADAKAVFTALREDTTLGETEVAALAPPAGGAPAGDAPKPADVTLQVLNASERTGLASQVGTELGKLEFAVASVGNADAPAERTVIRYPADQEQQAKVLGATVPDAALQLDESGTGVLQLVLGADFDGIVSPLASADGSTGLAGAQPPAPAVQPAATCR